MKNELQSLLLNTNLILIHIGKKWTPPQETSILFLFDE